MAHFQSPPKVRSTERKTLHWRQEYDCVVWCTCVYQCVYVNNTTLTDSRVFLIHFVHWYFVAHFMSSHFFTLYSHIFHSFSSKTSFNVVTIFFSFPLISCWIKCTANFILSLSSSATVSSMPVTTFTLAGSDFHLGLWWACAKWLSPRISVWNSLRLT